MKNKTVKNKTVPETLTLLEPIPYHTEDLKPLGAYFLVAVRGERKTKSGILVGNAFVTNHCQGTIVKIDDDISMFDWVQPRIKRLKVGDKIMFAPNNKYDVPNEGDDVIQHIMVPVQAIVGYYDSN